MLRSRASVAIVVLLAAGCGGHAAAKDPPVPPLSTTCGGGRGTATWLHTSDGQRLYAVEGGSGRTAVVLVPESPPGNVCGWLPYAATLERAGFRVLAFDYRGTGNSPATASDRYAFGQDLRAAVDRVRDDGADRVIAAGASFGGVVVMQTSSSSHVDGVISFSGETALPEYHVDALHTVPDLHAPLLIVGSRHDSYLSVADANRLLRRAGTRDKKLLLYPGDWHGWDIVGRAPYGARARAAVLAWLRAH